MPQKGNPWFVKSIDHIKNTPAMKARITAKNKTFSPLIKTMSGSIADLRHSGTYTIQADSFFTVSNCKFEELIVARKLLNLVIKNSVIKKITIQTSELTELEIDSSVIGNLDIDVTSHTTSVTINQSFINEFSHRGDKAKIVISKTRFLFVDIGGSDQIIKIEDTQKKCDTLTLSGNLKRITIVESDIIRIMFKETDSLELLIHRCFVRQLSFPPYLPHHIKFIEIKNSNIRDKIDLSSTIFSCFKVTQHSDLRNLVIRSKGWDDTIELSTSSIDDLTLSGIKTGETQNKLLLEDLYVQNLTVENSILDKTVFNLVHLDQSDLTITKSSLTQAVIHSVSWPRTYRVNEKLRSIPKYLNIHYEDLREVYRQLKVLSLKAENRIDAKLFMNSELRIYYKSISLTVLAKLHTVKFLHWIPFNLLMAIVFPLYFLQIPFLWLFRRHKKEYYKRLLFKWENFGNWLILHTNNIFSQFGESLTRPLIWLLIFHTCFFILLINKFDSLGLSVNFHDHDWEIFWKGLGIYVNLLSPVHSNKIPSVTSGFEVPIFGTIDFFMRIFASYFLFYFIKATRKFTF